MKAVMGVLVALAVQCLALAWLSRRPQTLVDRRLTKKSAEEYAAEFLVQAETTERQRKAFVPVYDRLEAEAKRLGLDVSGQAFFLIMLGACVALFVGTYGITRRPILGLAVAVLGVYAPRGYLNYQAQKRYRTFLRQFDAALLLAASSLRAGASVYQAFEEIAGKATPVIAEEFTRVLNGITLGATPGEALTILQRRIPGPEIDMFVVATQSLMKTGGNLADMYTQMASMIVEQREFRESMRASTAEGRMTAWVITLMPIGLLSFVALANPNYFDVFLDGPGGRIILLMCAAAYFVGWFVIRRLLEVQVD
jgi:tight adherence protein B